MIDSGSSTSLELTQVHFFYGCVICHCIYVPQLLYSFICQWTFRLFPSPSYCKECCNEDCSICLFQLLFYQSICPVVGLLGYMVVFFLVFQGISILSTMSAVSIYIPTNKASGFPYVYTLSSIYCL